ncbi:MAG: sensor domain-containing diguanylate cyclase [Cellulosilyticaceae bacterium]
MNEVGAIQYLMIEQLEMQLQQQRGMIWVLGEIMKVANNIGSLKALMKVITDMLMGVTGVNTCYLWAYDGDAEGIKVYLRSTRDQNEFMELDKEKIPSEIRTIGGTYMFPKEEIKAPLIEGNPIPSSRLAVPLIDFNDNSRLGVLVLEHDEPEFFNQNTIIFFETLAIFIASNTRNSRLFESVTQQSEIDPLTRTYNRRILTKVTHELMDEPKNMSVAVIDTDNFKKVNDTFGHIKGDEVLQTIAHTAKTYLKEKGGKVVRYGGDEFVLILPTSLEESMTIFEAFQKQVPQLDIVKTLGLPVSITMGVCAYPELTKEPHRLVVAADNALIRGKSQGKNRIIVAEEEDF